MTSTTSGRKRVNAKTYTADDQALGQIAREAEAKLAAKRAARNEAREIRMRELAKQQKENEEKQDRLYELTNDIPKASMRQFGGGNSRRGSEDSTTDEGSREMRSQLAELDEKYKKAMMGTAQLHNEKQSLVYEVELLKDQLEEREEEVIESQREFRDKCKELESKKRSYRDLETEFKNLKIQIEQRDKLIEENGLAIVISDEGEWTLVKASAPNGPLTAGLPTMGMVNSRLASEVDTSLAQHKCIQTDPCRNAPIVVRRFKATQTDEPDPATFRKVVDSVTTEVQTDDVPELLRAAIEHAEKITQTQSKPLEMSVEERFYQLVEYYRDVSVQTVLSKFAPWTASHTIEELPPKVKPRTPTPPPVVEVEPEEDEIEQLRAELNEDPIFDPSKFRKRMMSLTGSGSKDTEKKPSKVEVDPKVEAKPPPAPVAQKPEPIDIDQLFEIVEEEPVFSSSRYKKKSSAKAETQPAPSIESKPSANQQPTSEVQGQESVGVDQIFDTVEEEPVFDPSRYRKPMQPQSEAQTSVSESKPDVTQQQSDPVETTKPPTNVQRQESVGFDQIFDNVEEEPVFDPSQYRKPMQPQSEAQTPVSESKPDIAQQPDPVATTKPPTDIQRQESVGFDQIFDNVEEEPVFDPSRYLKRMQPQSEAQTPVSESKPDISQQPDPVATTKPPTEVQRQESVGFDQIFDNVEEESVFDPSRYMKRLSALPTAETQPPSVTEPKPTVSQQAPTEIKRQESVGFDQIFDNVEDEPVFDPSRYLKGFSASSPSKEQRQTPTKERSKTPCDVPSTQPSLELNDPSVSSSVESSHKTNEELPPSSGRDGYVTTSDSSPPAPLSHVCPAQKQLYTFDSQATQTDDGYSVPEFGTNLSIPPPCGPESETESELDSGASHRASSDSTVYDSALSLNGSTVDLRSEDRMSRGRSSFDSTTDYHSKRYGSNRDLTSNGRRNSALTNGQRSILSREASPKLSSISSRANSLRSIYSPEPVTQNHSFSSRETSIEPRSEAPTSVLDENQHLKAELKKLTDQLEEERSKKKNSEDNQIFQANGPEMQLYEIQREASKQIHEYKLKLQKAEQDIATLEGSVNRLDTQVKRYRTEAEDSEKLEDELKQEKRKLMRELREAQSQIEELRNHNSHLQKRLEKMKQSRSALVK